MFSRAKKGMSPYNHCVIQAGQIVYSFTPACVRAVCGNGAIVTMYDPIHKIGGMVHCVFPDMKGFSSVSNYHADTAIEGLYASLSKQSPLSRFAEAQLFGGGHYYGLKRERAEQLVEKMRVVLRALKVKIISEDIGGTMGRKVVLNTFSGETVVYKTKNIRRSDWMPEFPRAR